MALTRTSGAALPRRGAIIPVVVGLSQCMQLSMMTAFLPCSRVIVMPVIMARMDAGIGSFSIVEH